MALFIQKAGGLDYASGASKNLFESTPSVMLENALLASRTNIILIIVAPFLDASENGQDSLIFPWNGKKDQISLKSPWQFNEWIDFSDISLISFTWLAPWQNMPFYTELHEFKEKKEMF